MGIVISYALEKSGPKFIVETVFDTLAQAGEFIDERLHNFFDVTIYRDVDTFEVIRDELPGLHRIMIERIRQGEPKTTEVYGRPGEGWTIEHDDAHTDNSLALAAAVYALPYNFRRRFWEQLWPKSWSTHHYKPNYGGVDAEIRNLEKAGALIAAEIDRLLRILPNED